MDARKRKSLYQIRPHRLIPRAEAAEDACRAFRRLIAMPAYLQTTEQFSIAIDYLQRWMRLAGKSQYDDPRPIRRKRKE